MSGHDDNGRHATIELVNEKIKALRWEMRGYAVAIIATLSHADPAHVVGAFFSRLF